MDRLSPQEAGKERMPVVEGADELPLIRAFSDTAWMSWKALADATDSDPWEYPLLHVTINHE
jgi:hypothetical protein